MSNGSYRNWCFTSYEEPDVRSNSIEYCIYQKEKCPTTGRDHYQGYLEVKSKVRKTGVKKLMNSVTVHVEPRHGTQDQAIDYCMKLESKIGECVIKGKPKKQGNRSDLDSIYDACASGLKSNEILHEFKGHGMRYICHINKVLESVHGVSKIDRFIDHKRKLKKDLEEDYKITNPTTTSVPEVDGNTIGLGHLENMGTDMWYYMKYQEELEEAQNKYMCWV